MKYYSNKDMRTWTDEHLLRVINSASHALRNPLSRESVAKRMAEKELHRRRSRVVLHSQCYNSNHGGAPAGKDDR